MLIVKNIEDVVILNVFTFYLELFNKNTWI